MLREFHMPIYQFLLHHQYYYIHYIHLFLLLILKDEKKGKGGI